MPGVPGVKGHRGYTGSDGAKGMTEIKNLFPNNPVVKIPLNFVCRRGWSSRFEL